MSELAQDLQRRPRHHSAPGMKPRNDDEGVEVAGESISSSQGIKAS